MTKEQAIREIDSLDFYLQHHTDDYSEESHTAMMMAISALSENKGEWIKIQSGDKDFPESIVCSKCKNENSHLDFNEHGEPIGKVFVTSKFCPNCGADMREPQESER